MQPARQSSGAAVRLKRIQVKRGAWQLPVLVFSQAAAKRGNGLARRSRRKSGNFKLLYPVESWLLRFLADISLTPP